MSAQPRYKIVILSKENVRVGCDWCGFMSEVSGGDVSDDREPNVFSEASRKKV